MPDDNEFVHVDFVAQDPDVPKPGEEELCTDPECPGDRGWEICYGMAGGGIGAYTYCNKCEKVVNKTQDKMIEDEDEGGC